MTKQSWEKLNYLFGRGTDLLFNDEGKLLCSVGAIQDFVRTEKELSYAEGRKEALEGITKET